MRCTGSFHLPGISSRRFSARIVQTGFFGLLALLAGSNLSLAASPNQAPPLAAGMARVWFLQELVPGSSFYAPMLYVNGAKIAISSEGSAFYRDYAPGTYVFSIESCGPGPQPSQQLTVGANQQFALQVQNDDTAPSDCLVYYFTQVTPQMVPVVFAPLRYLGQK